jgi:serine/threonine protein kinase
MALSPGTHLGSYEVLAPLGAGGMGEVYRARDTRLGREVAIKILPDHLSSNSGARQRFEREAKTVSGLNHPNICTLHDIGHQDGVDFIVMEFIEGEPLEQRITKGRLPLGDVLKYGAQIADALDKAHRSGVIHRDLKPGNIMLTKSGAKLLDFGLAKSSTSLATMATVAATSHTSPLTQEGMIVGTFQYMSPEQVAGQELDARSDIFSFGAVLYEMLTGQRAFPGKSQLSVASAILEKDPEPAMVIAPLTPANLDHAIRRCLAKNRDERWQTALDLGSELKWIRESGSQASVPAIQRGKWQISTAGGMQPRWRGDSKELFYVASDGKIMAVPISGGANFDAGSPAALFQTIPRVLVATSELVNYDVAKDGQRFLINTQMKNAESQPMTIIQNWTTELKK